MTGEGGADRPGQAPWGAWGQQFAQLAQQFGSVDPAALAATAAQLAGWARDAVTAPHAAHGEDEPSAHPECVLCRAMAVVQAAVGESAAEREPEVAWIPIVRDRA